MKVLFISRAGKDGKISPIIKSQGDSLIKKGIKIKYFGIKSGGAAGYFKSAFTIRDILIEENYDLIHVHYGISGLAVLIARPRIPIVLSLMGDDILKLKRRDSRISIKGYIITYVINRSLKYYNAIIVKSSEMAKKVSILKTCVIPNGVSLERFRSIPIEKARGFLKIDMDCVLVLFPANKNRLEKNYELFEKAISLLKEKYSKIEVLWFNQVPHRDTVYYFNSANVVVLTSMHEGSPNVIKEAMACNIPIVSTDVGDVRKIINNTKGCFIAKNRPLDISRKIELALNFKRTEGRKNVKELESSVIADKIIKIYIQVLGE